ncbi:hypothetical protein KKB54_02250, partial [bacterium]|nr:hypothetical protein [bacterium]
MEIKEEIKERIIPVYIEDKMKSFYIDYAMSVIVGRALPDVRDGLKPVHRRILYAMNELGSFHNRPFKKSARIVGEVLGKYHPHGDTSVYEAMVRMAQDFSSRYCLVEGQGNFGSVDGDPPAAMRYTEVRLDSLAELMLADIDKETVSFTPNFDDTLKEPLVLPSKIPNLIINGSSGIAVGMATNIPPHNLAEVIDGVISIIEQPEIEIEELIKGIPGPDFPTGGIICGTKGIKEAYHTGRGCLTIRAKADIQELKQSREQIIITEIPYQVNKADLISKMADLVKDKKIEGISEIRDESDRDGLRVVIEVKRGENANIVLNQLYKHTQMQTTFGVIMLANSSKSYFIYDSYNSAIDSVKWINNSGANIAITETNDYIQTNAWTSVAGNQTSNLYTKTFVGIDLFMVDDIKFNIILDHNNVEDYRGQTQTKSYIKLADITIWGSSNLDGPNIDGRNNNEYLDGNVSFNLQ